jgi:hypothetical protein
MSLFDLLFIAVFLVSVACLIGAVVVTLGARFALARRILRIWGICAASYLGVVVVASLFWPRRVFSVGEPLCFDDWCIAVEGVSSTPAGGRVSMVATLRISSRARRVSQREKGVVVYLTDNSGRRFDAVRSEPAASFDILLQPGESVLATRTYEVPADSRELGLVIAHEGGFPIGWFIIGNEAWFHRPAILRLQHSQSTRRKE